ncbi:MAG: pantetheine-phosphate adenylyltransferase [Actinomycetales bacterium]|nr:pantetheine-phosphate adenylyltransferase [Actinomycetales bacterium]
MRSAVCPGSFDPVTNGHVDVFTRASDMADQVTIAVLVNRTKQSLFSLDERVALLTASVAHLPNVTVDVFEGLLVEWCRAHGVKHVIKGLRAVSDFDYELQMAQLNFRLAEVETAFVSTNPKYSFLSSSIVKEVARYGGDVSGLVPDAVSDALRAKFATTGGA